MSQRYLFLLRIITFHVITLIAVGTVSAQQNISQAGMPKKLELLLAADGEILAEQLVQEHARKAEYSLEALNEYRIADIRYLLPKRASEHLRKILDNNPNSPRAKLERYLILEFSSDVELEELILRLQANPDVLYIGKLKTTMYEFPLNTEAQQYSESLKQIQTPPQDWNREMLKIDEAWNYSPGHAMIGVIDIGLQTDHPELKAFNWNGSYLGGNYLPAWSVDIAEGDYNVDEREPVFLGGQCGWQQFPYPGHGTHVSGIIAANPDYNVGWTDFKGVCKDCDIAMWKTFKLKCFGGALQWGNPQEKVIAAYTHLVDIGVQVINHSGGNRTPNYQCSNGQADASWCLALERAMVRDIAIVAASGNSRLPRVNFPARDESVIAVGGIESDGNFWDDIGECPDIDHNKLDYPECGSNHSIEGEDGGTGQELVAPAKSVYSTFYEGFDYYPLIGCTENGGYGFCTGTSMSAPQVAGIIGLMRSANPLVKATYNPGSFEIVKSIRGTLTKTTQQAQQGLPWDPKMGYGVPDAEAAVKEILGTVGGQQVVNRVTPLFAMYSPLAQDRAYTTTPSIAVAFSYYQAAPYDSDNGKLTQVPLVPGYSKFPPEPLMGPAPKPRASLYIMTTPNKPFKNSPDLIPLYRMSRNSPCKKYQKSCNPLNRDIAHVVVPKPFEYDELEEYKEAGYDLHGMEGYIYGLCGINQLSCMPPSGTVSVYRVYHEAMDDTAIVPESELTAMQKAGYTNPEKIGYAYPSQDSDGDLLIDGFERVVGTNPYNSDSDGDGTNDRFEFPMTNVQASDPLIAD